MTYVDGYVLPVPEDKIEQYRTIAQTAGNLWMEHGALSYKEFIIEDAKPKTPDDVPPGFAFIHFHDLAKASAGETVVFAFITYKSRAHRDEVNAKVHNDPRMKEACDAGSGIPFNPNRMAYGGFNSIVDL